MYCVIAHYISGSMHCKSTISYIMYHKPSCNILVAVMVIGPSVLAIKLKRIMMHCFCRVWFTIYNWNKKSPSRKLQNIPPYMISTLAYDCHCQCQLIGTHFGILNHCHRSKHGHRCHHHRIGGCSINYDFHCLRSCSRLSRNRPSKGEQKLEGVVVVALEEKKWISWRVLSFFFFFFKGPCRRSTNKN